MGLLLAMGLFCTFTAHVHAQTAARVQLVERARPTQEGPFSANSDLILSRDPIDAPNPKSPGMLQMWNWRTQEFVGPKLLFNSYQKRMYEEGRYNQYDPVSGEPSFDSPRLSKDGRFYGGCRMFRDNPEGKRTPNEYILAQVWNVRTGETAAEIPRPTKEQCVALDFSPDGNSMVMAVEVFRGSKAVVFYDTTTWQEKHRHVFGPEVQAIGGHHHIRFSPNGKQVVVGIQDMNYGPQATTVFNGNEFRKIHGGVLFGDSRFAAVVLDASNAKVLARKVLHWSPTWVGSGSNPIFDATGERVLSHEGSEAIRLDDYLACLNYTPPNVPQGFAPEDLCRRHQRVVVWHWRTDRIDQLVAGETHVANSADEPAQMIRYGFAGFTPDGRYLLRKVQVTEKKDKYKIQGKHPATSESLEFLDANTYQVLARQVFKPHMQRVYDLDLSQDGRYLKFTVREGQEHGQRPFTPYLYEIVPQ